MLFNEYIFDFNPTNSLICGGVNNKIKHKEFFYVLFKKKVIRLNMKRIQSNYCTEMEPMMFVRFHCLVLMIKDIY